MEGDDVCDVSSFAFKNISIHTLRVEGDLVMMLLLIAKILFQSTPSVWRVTKVRKSMTLKELISIHTLRVEGDFVKLLSVFGKIGISIHTLRVEGDT